MLTPVAVKAAKPGATRREISDGGCAGLYLVIQPSGAKSWAFRYRFAGRPKKLTIGPAYRGDAGDEPEHAALDQPNTLAGTRELAGGAARQVAKGIDPATHKRRERHSARLRAEHAEMLDRDTVEAVARLFITKHAMANTRETSWRQAARLIGLKPDPEDDTKLIRTASGGEVLSVWGGRTIHEITRRDVHDLLDRVVSRGSPITANRVLAAVRKMFAWAMSRDIVTASPCAGVPPPSSETSRDRVLSDDELRLIWKASDVIDWPFGPVVQMLILTLQRRDEVADMSHVEIREKTWIIPKERVKNGIEHEVPLSAPAVTLLSKLPKIGARGLVFTITGETPVSGFSKAKTRLDAEIVKAHGAALPHWTLHDLRRTGASGMARLGIQLPVIEKILNHSSGSFGGVAGVYQRHSYSAEKRKALDTWARFVTATVSGKRSGNVVPLRPGK